MALVTSIEEQQQLRTELEQACVNKDSDLHEKFVAAAVQSSTTFALSKSVDGLQKSVQQQAQSLGSIKREMKPSSTTPNGGPAKKPKTDKPKSGNAAWMSLKQDSTLKYCPAFDRATRRQCGWNNSHLWGPNCPILKDNPDYVPRFWGPQGSNWASAEDASKGAPVADMKKWYKADVERVRAKAKK